MIYFWPEFDFFFLKKKFMDIATPPTIHMDTYIYLFIYTLRGVYYHYIYYLDFFFFFLFLSNYHRILFISPIYIYI